MTQYINGNIPVPTESKDINGNYNWMAIRSGLPSNFTTLTAGSLSLKNPLTIPGNPWDDKYNSGQNCNGSIIYNCPSNIDAGIALVANITPTAIATTATPVVIAGAYTIPYVAFPNTLVSTIADGSIVTNTAAVTPRYSIYVYMELISIGNDPVTGITVNIGYAETSIDNAAIEQICNGNNLTRPSMIELEAAELLVNLIDSVDMVKFTKNGSSNE